MHAEWYLPEASLQVGSETWQPTKNHCKESMIGSTLNNNNNNNYNNNNNKKRMLTWKPKKMWAPTLNNNSNNNNNLKAQENVGSNTQQQQQQQQQQPESPGKCGPHQPSPALSSPPCQLLPPLTSCTMCPFLRNILKSGNHTLTQSIYNQNTIMLWVGLGRVTAMVEVQSLEWVSNYCNAIWDLEVALSEAFSGMGINIMYLRLLLFQEHCSSGAKSVLKFDNQG